MTLDEAKVILGEPTVDDEGGMIGWPLLEEYHYWKMEYGTEEIVMDGTFTASQLEALATFMREWKG